jgi:hypothetical protein
MFSQHKDNMNRQENQEVFCSNNAVLSFREANSLFFFFQYVIR